MLSHGVDGELVRSMLFIENGCDSLFLSSNVVWRRLHLKYRT